MFVSIVYFISIAQCDRSTIINDYLTNYQPNDFTVNELNWTGNISNCIPGNYNANINTKMLNRLKFLRRLCALDDNVSFVGSLNTKCRKATLMFEANENISHCFDTDNPPCSTWQCTSEDAFLAAQQSNLVYADWDYDDPFDLYILEEGSFNDAVPHLRWLLYSKGKTFGNAVSPNSNVLYIYDNFNNASNNQKEYIAFPPEGFVPAPLIKNKWFFAIPDADFSNATVTIKDKNGNNIPLTITARNGSYGDKAITWIINNIDTNNSYDVRYTVTINNVINSLFNTYTYTIIVAQPVHPPACPPNLVWNDNLCDCTSEPNCQQNFYINNQNITSRAYKASNQITVQNSTILSNQNVQFIAENRVSIGNQFSTRSGVTLKIDIQNCQ